MFYYHYIVSLRLLEVILTSSPCLAFISVRTQIGHNLGFAHSNEGNEEYGDETGMMGFSYPDQDEGPAKCFNAAKSWQSRWYDSKRTTVDLFAGDCFEGKLYGIADFGDTASSIVLLKITGSTDADFYVTFNRQSGINSGTGEAENLVTVVTTEGEGADPPRSFLLAKLGTGATWRRVVDGRAIVVDVLSINTRASPVYAEVRISENGVRCTSSKSGKSW